MRNTPAAARMALAGTRRRPGFDITLPRRSSIACGCTSRSSDVRTLIDPSLGFLARTLLPSPPGLSRLRRLSVFLLRQHGGGGMGPCRPYAIALPQVGGGVF